MTQRFAAVSFLVYIALYVSPPVGAANAPNYLNVQVVDMPQANKVITIPLVPRTVIKFNFDPEDASQRSLQGANVIYSFDNGGKIVFSEYLAARKSGLESTKIGEFTSAILLPEGRLTPIKDLLPGEGGPSEEELLQSYPKTGVSTFNPKRIPNIQALARAYSDNAVLSKPLLEADHFQFYAFVLFKDNSFNQRSARLAVTRAYMCLFDKTSDLALLGLSPNEIGMLYYPLKFSSEFPDETNGDEILDDYNYALGLQLWQRISRSRGSDLPSMTIVGFEGTQKYQTIGAMLAASGDRVPFVVNLENLSLSQISKLFLTLRERLEIPATGKNLSSLADQSIAAFRRLLRSIGKLVTAITADTQARAQSVRESPCGRRN